MQRHPRLSAKTYRPNQLSSSFAVIMFFSSESVMLLAMPISMSTKHVRHVSHNILCRGLHRYLGQTDIRGGGILVKTMVIFMFVVHKGRTF